MTTTHKNIVASPEWVPENCLRAGRLHQKYTNPHKENSSILFLLRKILPKKAPKSKRQNGERSINILYDDFTVLSRGLACGGSVIIPFR